MRQRSTCRWCKRPIERATETADWKSDFFSLLSGDGNRECPEAPNPDDGPMPNHDAGTTVVNEDGTLASER
jgi:hypothetical protein